MPLYEYRCSQCDRLFEVIQKFSDEPLTVHEGCGGAVERLISAPGLHFKGSGWYITDYARSGSSKGGSKESSKEGKTETKSETKTQAPAAKPDTSPSTKA